MPDNKRLLYDALSQDYDLGTFEQFSTDIEDENKRRKLYDATAEEYDYGDYDSFSKQLGFGVATPVERISNDPQKVSEGRAMFNSAVASRKPETSSYEQAPEATKEYIEQNPAQGGKVEWTPEAIAQRKAIAMEEVKAESDFVNEYDQRWAEYQADVDNELSGPEVDEKKKWLDENNQRYREAKDAISEVEGKFNMGFQNTNLERLAEKKRENQSHVNPRITSSGGMAPVWYAPKENDQAESENYEAANEIISMAEQTYKQGSKSDPGYDGNWLEQAWTAARQFVECGANNFDKGSLTFGLSEGSALTMARRTGDKYNKIVNDTLKEMGYSDKDVEEILQSVDAEKYYAIVSRIDSALDEKLTDGERAILDALEEFTAAKIARANDVSIASAAGAGAEQSAEFMLDFILTGGMEKAATKAATKLASTRLLKKLGEKGANAVAMGLADAGVAAARTAAMFPRNLSAYGENLVQMNPEMQKDELGRYNFDRSHLNAALNTALTQYIEYWSEGFGEYFGAIERDAFKKVTKAAPKTTIGKTLNQYRGSIGKYLDHGKFNGMFNEMLEEVVGSGFNALAGWMSGDRIGDQEAMKDFFSGEQLATLALSFLPMSAISARTNIKAYNTMKNRYNDAVKTLNPFINSGAISRGELDELVNDIANKTPEEIKDKIVEISDKARRSETAHGVLPANFAQSLLGYVEGTFAMQLENETWENSQEKMAVVDAYTSQYDNPDERNAYDLNQLEAETRAAAAAAGFDEDMLNQDAYMMAKYAQSIQEEQPEQSRVLLQYAQAKAANAGLRAGYDEETRAMFDEYENVVRSNADNNGNVILAMMGNGRPVLITSKDATVGADGNVSVPTGEDGLVTFINANGGGAVGQAKASAFSGAASIPTDFFILDQEQKFFDSRNNAFVNAENTISFAGQQRAIASKIGQNVYIRGGGAFEPVQVVRMTNNGQNVVITGDKEALKGVAIAAGIDTPGGQNLEIPVQLLYPMLSTEADGSLTTDQPEAAQESTEETATKHRPQEGGLSLDGRPISVIGENGEFVEFTYKDDPDAMIQTMDADEFRSTTGYGEAPAETQEQVEPEPAATEPVVEEAPQPAEQASAIPIDENTGEPMYDAKGITPETALDAMVKDFGNEEDAVEYIIEQSDSSRKALKKAQNLVKKGEEEKAEIEAWRKEPGEGPIALRKRKDEAIANVNERISKAQEDLPELERKNELWETLRGAADQYRGETKEEAELQKQIEKYGVDTRNFEKDPKSLDEAIAYALGGFFNGGGKLNYQDVVDVTGIDERSLLKQGWKFVLSKDGISIDNFVHNILAGDSATAGFVKDEQDAINRVGEMLQTMSRGELGKLIFKNRLAEAIKERDYVEGTEQLEQQNGASEEEDIPASEAADEAPEGTDMTEVEEPVSEPAEPEVTTAEDEDMPEDGPTPVEKTEVKQHPGSLREAYESGDAQRIADAEKAMADFINSSDSVVLLRNTGASAKRRRKAAEKDSAEYKTQDFIAKAVKNRIAQLDKAEVSAFDAAREVYEDRFTADKEAIQSAIAFFENELATAQDLLENVPEGADDLYVIGLKNRIGSAKRYIDALNAEMKRFEEEDQEQKAPVEESVSEVKPTKEPEKKEVKPSSEDKIEDFGEKIGGARKDLYRSRIRDAVKLTSKDLKELKDPDKILSRKQIISLMEKGEMTKADAQTLLALNMATRATSDSFGMKTLALTKYRDMAAEWEKGEDLSFDITDGDMDFLISHYSERIQQMPNFREKERASVEALLMKVFNDYKATYEAIDYPAVNRALRGAYIRPGSADGRFWVVSGPSSYRGWPFATMDQAAAKMESEYPEIKKDESKNEKPEEGQSDKIGNLTVTKDDNGWYRVKSRSIPGKIYLSKKFYTKKQAEQFLKDNAITLVDREQKMVDALLGSNIGMVKREGRDYRGDKDVTPDQMLETFGFRGVEFGNWVPQAERQEYLNKTYDAIMDFCDIVGISPKAFSLGGRLGLAFGARGHSRALAHYEPMKEVINLTRMKGAGSLAHEWFHALDNYLAKQKTGNISDMATSTRDTVREATAKAFRDFVEAMDKLDYSKRSQRAGDYWGEVWERAARLFESYVYNELASKSVVSPLLVRKDTLFDDSISDENVQSAWPYPSIAENEQMKPFFDNLFQTIEERVQEDGKVALAGLDSTTSDVQSEDKVRTYTPTVPEVNHAEYQKRLDEVAEKMNGVAHNSSEYKELIKRQEEILSEYQDAIDPKHVPTSFRTYDQLEDYFLSIGMSETSAKTNADYMRDNEAYGAYMRGRMVFVNEKNTNLEAFRDHYVHERQHHLNERDGIAKKLFDKVGGNLDMLESALSKFVGTSHAATYRFYYQFNNQPEAIADEVIAYAMGLAYYEPAFANDPKFSQLAKEIQDFINDQVNEQFEDSYRPAIQGQRYQYLNDRGRRSSGAQTSEGESGGVSDGSRRNDEGIEGDQTPRFGLETDPDVLAKLENGKKVKVYRAMQLIDGKLYPPMSAKVDGKLREPIELGKWEVAEERPELADKDGNFVLNKGNGSSLKAKYNPYFHTSRSPLNDQFTSAYNRPNLVTVEVEVPESELTSGYKAKNAKDAVGEMTWHSGPVSGKLPEGKKRKVILSRWDKPVRVLSDSEVADRIAELLDGENIAIPYNVVTPGLRAELAQRGVAISDSPSGTVRDNTLRSREGGTVERRVSAAEREVTNATLDTMSDELGIKISRVSREQMPKGHESAKGYYDPRTGEMTICMDNVMDERDAIATVFHETVSHHGLRKLLGPRFNEAMVRIYAALDAKGKAWVNAYMRSHNLHPGDEGIIRGMEEYMANLAESGDFKKSTWDKIKEIFERIVDKLLGTDGFVFTDNELNYILRASYEHLKNPNWLNTMEGKALDTLMKRALGINETDPNRPTDPEGPETGILYRDGYTGAANEDYEREMNDNWNAIVTENQNSDLPVKIGMEKVMKEVGKEKLEENEDYLTRHNLASSRAESEAHEFELSRFKPLLEQVRTIRDKLTSAKSTKEEREKAYERVLDYLYAVSGLERNAYKNAEIEQAKQDALQGITEQSEIDKITKEFDNKKKDWSGLTSLMGMRPGLWQAAEARAQAMVEDFKRDVGDDAALDELWNRIRACTDFSLGHAYKHGLLTRDEFEKLHGTASQPRMWNYYLPLRGFNEQTAEEEYNYSTFVNPSRNSVVVKKMNGRWTQADNPLANILNIAETEIVQGNDNWAKQALYRFVLNAGENSLLTQVEPWYVKDPATGNWSIAEPYGGESLEDFENRMQQNRTLYPDNYKKGRRGLRLDRIMANKAHRNEHMIRLKVGGVDKMIWVNGDPALAKAVTGMSRAQNLQWIRRASRALSNLFTTYSLDFTAKNLLRDTIYSQIALLVKEDRPYRQQYRKNWIKNFGYGLFAYPMIQMAAQWEDGRLLEKEKAGTLNPRESMFLEFMRNGGQTGYTIVNSVSQIKKDLEKSMRRAGSASYTFPVFGHYAKAVKTLNEAFELLTRFTAYQTSRDMGRSGQRSASDAKEISVNFNRRGAQSGEGLWGTLASYLGATHYFYNAGVQGFDNFLRLFKVKPVTMSAITTGFVMMGMMTPMINAMLAGLFSGGDGDDDELKSVDWYWNLPEWVRRNNLILGNGKWYIAIPLPVEFRAPYGIGDITGSAFLFEKTPNRKFGNVSLDILSTAANILPVNPVEGYNGNLGDAVLRAVVPDVGMFFVDWATNRDYTGRPLWKENPFSNTVPMSQGAYASTPKGIVIACQKLAQVSNGAIDIPPGLVRDAMNNYGGGFFRAAEDVSKIMFGLFDNDPDRPFRWDNVPFFSGFSGHIDEDRSDSFATNALYEYKNVSDGVVKSLNAALVTDEVTAAIAYDNPDSLYEMAETIYQKAKVKRILESDDYKLGEIYRNGMNNEYVMKQRTRNDYKNGHYAGEWYKSRDVKRKGVETLRIEWRAAREKWASLPDKTEEEKAAKADAYKDVTNAWHEYYNAKADLVDQLMKFEYNHRTEGSNSE